MTYDRRLNVLRAIVTDYVQTREPVASKALVERYKFGVSPATIRNDMAILEENGLIHQPHTSAGRVPTNAGYRMFVDQISEIKPLSVPERNAIHSFLSDALDIDDVVDRSVKLLAQLTNQAAVVQYPSIRSQVLKHIEIVSLSPKKILVIFITTNGYIDRKVIDTPQIDQQDLADLRLKLNIACTGMRSEQVVVSLDDLYASLPPVQARIVQLIREVIVNILNISLDEKIVTAGSANLVKADEDFSNSIAPVLDALEEQVVLLRLFSNMKGNKTVEVSIGAENQCNDLSETSIVTGSYGTDGAKAHISVIGPTRMDYVQNMSAVEAVCNYLSDYLTKNG